jgi:hypothetical protein
MTHIPYDRVQKIAGSGLRTEATASPEHVLSPEESAHIQECSNCLETLAEAVRNIVRVRSKFQ